MSFYRAPLLFELIVFFVELQKKCLTRVVGVAKVCELLIRAEPEGCNNKYHQICVLGPCDEQKGSENKIVT